MGGKELVMDTKEKLINANLNLPTINLKGKNYVMVKDRVKAFRTWFADWSLYTDIVAVDDNSVTIKATIADEAGRIMATGIANEVAGSSNVNRTSHYENCESSAIGRALGNLGIGIDDSFGSADEVANAILQQEADGIIDEQEAKTIKDLLEVTGSDVPAFLSYYNVNSVEQLHKSQYAKAVKQLQKKQK